MNNQITVNFPVPPPDAVMPETLQLVMLVGAAIGAAVVLAWGVYLCIREKTLLPFVLATGGFVAILMETVVTFLGHAIHPEPGQIMMFKAVDRAIPWHIALGYMAGFGILNLSLYSAFLRKAITNKTIWKAALITAFGYFFGEAYFVSNGVWIYYDYQPLHVWKGTAPLTWNWMNAASMFTSFTLMLYMSRYWKGLATLLLLVLAPAGAYVGHMGSGFLMYNVINTDWPAWVMELSGIITVAMAILFIWLCGRVLLALQAEVAS